MKKKTLTLNYYRAGKPTGQTRTKTFINNEDTYCPNCGDSCNVWVEESYGDYYVGPSYYCCTCKYKFAIPHLQEIKADGPFADAILELEIIDKLRSPPQEPRCDSLFPGGHGESRTCVLSKGHSAAHVYSSTPQEEDE